MQGPVKEILMALGYMWDNTVVARRKRIAPPNAHICPHLIKRYELNSNLPLSTRAIRIQRRHSFGGLFYPRIDGLRLDA